MSTKLGPDPLPTTIARAHVREHRNLFCSNYDACLGRAAHEDWASWTCAHCARFHVPPPFLRPPATLDPDGDDDVVVAAAPPIVRVARGDRRARPAPASRADHDGHRDHNVGAHFVDQENGTVHVRLEAACMAALFVEAARAVADVVRARPLEPVTAVAEEVSVAATDWEHLLVAWIAELLARSERSNAWFTEFDIVYLAKNRIVASIRGIRVAPVHPPKIGPYRDPCLERRGDQVSATPVLDG